MFHNHIGWRHRVRAFLFGDGDRAVEPYYDDRSYADPGIGSRRAARNRDDGRPIPAFLSSPAPSPIEQEICDHLAEKGYHPQPGAAAVRPWRDDVVRALAGISRPRGILRPQPVVANGMGGNAAGHDRDQDGEAEDAGAYYAHPANRPFGPADAGLSGQNGYAQHDRSRYGQHVHSLRTVQDSEVFGAPGVRMTIADPDIEAFVAKVRALTAERDQLIEKNDGLAKITSEQHTRINELEERLAKITEALGQS
jgi:hypothetical protein